MLFGRKNVNSVNHTKPSSILRWKNSDLINVEAAGLHYPSTTACDTMTPEQVSSQTHACNK